MRGYNLYYKYDKINKNILSKEEVKQVLSNKYIYKKTDNGVQHIPASDVRCYEVVII